MQVVRAGRKRPPENRKLIMVRLRQKIKTLVALLWLAAYQPVYGQVDSSPSTSDACTVDPICAEHYEKARSFSKEGRFEEALAHYMAAYSMHPVPTLLFNIGRVNHRLGRNQDAINSYQNYLSQAGETDTALREKAKDYLSQLTLQRATSNSHNTVSTTISGRQMPSAVTQEQTPIYNKWWFWTGLGVLVAGGTIAIIVGTQVDFRARPREIIDLRGQL